MDFSYGVIAAVGVLVVISLGLIAVAPDDIIEPRIIPIAEISVNSHIMPKTATVGDVLLIEVEFRDDDKKIVDHVNYDIIATQDGNIILSDFGSHRHPGMHPIHETTVLSESPLEIQVTLQGLGHGDDISEPKGIVTTMTVNPELGPTACTMQWDPMCGVDGETYGNLCMLDAAHIKLDYEGECDITQPESEPTPEPDATPEPEVTPEPEPTPETSSMALTVSIPKGVGVPGCETTLECYSPYEITVATGTTVTWINDDTTVHTVTSGKITSGTTGLFDSSIFTPGESFEFTFNDEGTYDYFCNVHPWMAGIVHVTKSQATPEPEPTPETSSMALTISIPEGVGAPGCEITHECYLPHEVTVAVGATVTWVNNDLAAHTVTSGVPPDATGVFDSGLFMSGSTFEFTFDDAGTYDYYCMVHPWMTGIVNVS